VERARQLIATTARAGASLVYSFRKARVVGVSPSVAPNISLCVAATTITASTGGTGRMCDIGK